MLALSRRRSLIRWLLFVLSYLTCCIVISYAARWGIQYADDNQPGRFFYHLEQDEAPGPLGDTDLAGWVILLDYLGFLVLMVPVSRAFGLRWKSIALLAVLHEPVMLAAIVALVTARLL